MPSDPIILITSKMETHAKKIDSWRFCFSVALIFIQALNLSDGKLLLGAQKCAQKNANYACEYAQKLGEICSGISSKK